MRIFHFVAFALTAGLTSFAVSQVPAAGPISGIATSNFGVGAGLGAPPVLNLGWDPANHALVVKITPPEASISDHYLAYGSTPFPTPFPLPAPFWVAGSVLYPVPLDVVGPFPGSLSVIAVPQDPNLVGQVFYLQGLPQYAVAAPFPVYGATQGVKLQFQ